MFSRCWLWPQVTLSAAVALTQPGSPQVQLQSESTPVVEQHFKVIQKTARQAMFNAGQQQQSPPALPLLKHPTLPKLLLWFFNASARCDAQPLRSVVLELKSKTCNLINNTQGVQSGLEQCFPCMWSIEVSTGFTETQSSGLLLITMWRSPLKPHASLQGQTRWAGYSRGQAGGWKTICLCLTRCLEGDHCLRSDLESCWFVKSNICMRIFSLPGDAARVCCWKLVRNSWVVSELWLSVGKCTPAAPSTVSPHDCRG